MQKTSYWQPPRHGFFKLNTDGRVRPGRMRAPNYSRSWMISKLRAWDRGIRKLEIETDNKTVFRILHSNVGSNGHAIVRRIRHYVDQQWQLVFKHVPRLANSVADSMTKFGRLSLVTDLSYAPSVTAYQSDSQ
ncbi:hypothetical protein F3Y22_tig00111640pilonHSYRG00224 [Hibiscus syriacus]|uniref:RNase H type-1 domain-containing protein n=1 Tax=Hibiscus syriacus TaxID=106335 RepID=A0A6A2YJ42_HIBSY|nr:hypothetical protein F3Y22_tig00111640pilonHSYRG00224 [Hibiscus syriacus]